MLSTLREWLVFAVLVGVPACLAKVISGWHWGFCLLAGYVLMMGTMMILSAQDERASKACEERIGRTPCPDCGGSFGEYAPGPHGQGRQWLLCSGCRKEVAFTYKGEIATDQKRPE